jgi:hypothetical protein
MQTDLMRFNLHSIARTFLLCVFLYTAPLYSWAEETTESPKDETSDSATSTASQEPIDIPKRSEPQPQSIRFSTQENQHILTSDQEWVELGTDAFTAKGLLTLHQNAVVRGTVLLYPDSGTHQDWPRLTHALRQELPKTGWNTLSLPIPEITTRTIPKRTLPTLKLLRKKNTDAASNTTESSNESETPEQSPNEQSTEPSSNDNITNKEPSNENTEQNLTGDAAIESFNLEEVFALNSSQTLAAVKRAQSLGDYPIVILGIGDGSVWAARAAQALQNQAPTVLMMIDPYPLKQSDQTVTGIIHQLDLPIMDIALPESIESRLSNNTTTQQQRQAIAYRAEKTLYRTARIPVQSWSKNQNDWWVRYIDGRMRTLITLLENTTQPLPDIAPLGEIPPGGKG